jgi:hypothetical protein
MATYTTFINSVLYLPNPNQNLDRSLPTSLRWRGSRDGAPGFSNRYRHGAWTEHVPVLPYHRSRSGHEPADPARPDTQAQQPMKVPQLRAIYQKELFDRQATTTIDGFGLVHDGAWSNIAAFLQDTAFSGYTQTEKNDIAAYSLCFDTGRLRPSGTRAR